MKSLTISRLLSGREKINARKGSKKKGYFVAS